MRFFRWWNFETTQPSQENPSVINILWVLCDFTKRERKSSNVRKKTSCFCGFVFCRAVREAFTHACGKRFWKIQILWQLTAGRSLSRWSFRAHVSTFAPFPQKTFWSRSSNAFTVQEIVCCSDLAGASLEDWIPEMDSFRDKKCQTRTHTRKIDTTFVEGFFFLHVGHAHVLSCPSCWPV